MILIGIDQGMSGAVAALDTAPERRLCSVADMPTQTRLVGKGSEVDAHTLASWLDLTGAKVAWVEVAQVMPSTKDRRGMGAVSSFNFGRAAGAVYGALAALGFQINFVRPTAWKKHFGLTGKDKHASITLAKDMFPDAAQYLTRKKDHGRAEAMLIACYGADVLDAQRQQE